MDIHIQNGRHNFIYFFYFCLRLQNTHFNTSYFTYIFRFNPLEMIMAVKLIFKQRKFILKCNECLRDDFKQIHPRDLPSLEFVKLPRNSQQTFWRTADIDETHQGPRKSLRQTSREIGISKSSFHRIFKCYH